MAERRLNPYQSPLNNLGKNLSLGTDNLTNIAVAVIICDTVFRGISAIQLLGYFTTIGHFGAVLKFTGYAAGIAGNIGILTRQKWGVVLGLVAAAIGLWLWVNDLWSLFHLAYGAGLAKATNFFIVRNVIKQLVRGAWLGLYVAALLLLSGKMARTS